MEPKLEYAFSVHLEVDQRLQFGELPNGTRRAYARTFGGTVTGPRLSGKVLRYSGGDWPLRRSDGVVQLDATYLLEADDGAVIIIRNRGYRHAASPEILKRLEDFEPVDPALYYFRFAPRFEAPKGPHDWLNRTVIVGGAERTRTSVDFTYYAVL